MRAWLFPSQLLCQKNYIYRHWTRHDTELLSSRLYHRKIAFALLLIIGYLSAVRFGRDLAAILIWLFQSVISSERLHMPCCWLSDTFPLYGLPWLDHSFVIVERRWLRNTGMTVRVSCSVKWTVLTGRLNASRYRWLLEPIVSSEDLHLPCHRLRYVSAVWLDRDLLYGLSACSWSVVIPCQCQCLIS